MSDRPAAIVAPPIELDVFADVACPWCFIAHRRLGRAIDAAPELGIVAAPVFRWRAFQLTPDTPERGGDAIKLFDPGVGGGRRHEAMLAELTELGSGEGIRFAFGKQRVVNTQLAHRIISMARTAADPEPAVDDPDEPAEREVRELLIDADQRSVAGALFSALFEDGVDLADLDQTLGYLVGRGVAVDARAVRRELAAGAGRDRVRDDLGIGAAIGIDAVPVVMANRRHAVWGAQPEIVFRRLLVVADSDAGEQGLETDAGPIEAAEVCRAERPAEGRTRLRVQAANGDRPHDTAHRI